MKVITDPIYGSMQLNDTEIKLISTPEFQRLKRIKHLGFVDHVYPSAVHTRDTHALGVAFLVRKIGKNLGLDEVTIEMLRIAALLHDVGHGPYSHESDSILEYYSGTNHEQISSNLIKKQFSEIISDRGLSPNTIADIICREKGPYYDLVRGKFDVDYIDCLTRDSYYTGVTSGRIDFERLANVLAYKDGKLCVLEKGKSALESFFVSKHLMFAAVYHHHVTEISKAMFQKALELAILNNKVDPKKAWRLDDSEMRLALKEAGGLSQKLMERIEARRLYKRVLWLKKPDVNEVLFAKLIKCKSDRKMLDLLETELASGLGIEYGDILVDISNPPERSLSNGDAGIKFIMRDGSMKPLAEVSPLIKALGEAQWDFWKVGVYAPEEKLKSIDPVKVLELMKAFEPVKLSDYL